MTKRKRRIRKPPASQGPRLRTHESSDINFDTLPPVFSLEHMVDGYCVASCDSEQKAAFAEALHQRSKLSWAELRSAPRHGLGTEKIDRASLMVHLPPGVSPDLTILAFRFWKKAPMIGFRSDRVFNILWLDHGFSVYRH